MKAFTKTLIRTFLSNKGRFLSNALISLISLAISGGLAVMPDLYEASYIDTNYKDKSLPDIILKNKTEDGFSDEDLENIKKDSDVLGVEALTSMDYKSDSSIYRIYIQDLHSNVCKLTLLEGEYPTETYDFSKEIPVLAIEGNNNRNIYSIGDVVNIKLDYLSELMSEDGEEIDIPSILGRDSFDIKIVGIVSSPLYCSVQKENAMLEDEDDKYIDSAFYFEKDLFPETITVLGFNVPLSSFISNTDVQIKYSTDKAYFSSSYEKEMEKKKDALISTFGEDKVTALTLEENVSYSLFKTYNEKVRKITYVFPVFFVVVCALVNLITISRLIKDERGQVATYLSLGVSKSKIVTKYTLFSFISVAIGGIVGLAIGIPLIPTVVLPAYQSVFVMSNLGIKFFSLFAYLLYFAIIVVSLAVTLYCSLKMFNQTPAALMKGEAPKAGKKILLERITFIWKRLAFRFKSSFRNIFRQKKNLILTSLSVVGSMVLLMLGFGLLDVSEALKDDALFGNVASSMGLISFVIIAFAVSMTIVVVYSLANMNIQDRQREIATLKVLGYHDKECSMYTFREIMIISASAALLALPISAGIIAFVFDWLDFGTIGDVKWYSYIASYAILIATTIIINLLLYPKIKEVDMNESLKTLD